MTTPKLDSAIIARLTHAMEYHSFYDVGPDEFAVSLVRPSDLREVLAKTALLQKMELALKQIAGGDFPGAGDMAASGQWQLMYNWLQNIAKTALTEDKP